MKATIEPWHVEDIKCAMAKKRNSLAAVAREFGVTRQTVSNIIRGDASHYNPALGAEVRTRIAEIIGVGVDDIWSN